MQIDKKIYISETSHIRASPNGVEVPTFVSLKPIRNVHRVAVELLALELIFQMAFEDIAQFFVFMQIAAFEESNVRILVSVHFCFRIIVYPHHAQALGTNHFIL